MSNARFSILQARAVKDCNISDAQFRTLAALGMYADKDGWCYPLLSTLGNDLGKSKQAVGRDTIALRKLGYLEVTARHDKNGSRRSSMYRLIFDLPCQRDVDTPSTSLSDTPSTSEVDVNVPSNAPKERIGASAPPNLGLEWQLTHGQAVTQHDLDVQKEADYRNSADTIAVEFGVNRNVAYDIALSFMQARQMVIPQGRVKGQRKAVKEMIQSGVSGEHVKAAVKKLIEEGMTITDLFSVVRTAIDIANPKPEVERLRVSKAGGHAESRNPLGI